MALIEDDFIMTIGDDDEVPDLEAVANDAPPPQNKRKLNGKQKGGKKAKPQETKDEGDMTKGFLVDLETDGLDAVPQTLDFTLARASLKKRRNPGMYSTLDEKIALSRRAAKIARLAALDKPDEMEVSEEEEVVESVSDNNDEDVESASDGEEEKGGSDEEEEDASDDDEENSMVDAPVLEDESGSEVESDEEEESESEVDSESEESED
ncbi:hypothetical protein GGI13_002266, partial [Coemansia sp. RSA 455]